LLSVGWKTKTVRISEILGVESVLVSMQLHLEGGSHEDCCREIYFSDDLSWHNDMLSSC